MPLRLALIGAGAMGRQHCAVVAGDPRAELCAIADPSETADTLATEYAVPRYKNHIALLAQARPDAVIIANPNQRHVDTALDCVRAKVPALIEKPVGVSLIDVTDLVEAERQGTVPLLIGHHRRHNPLIAKTRELIEGGLLGRLTTVTALWQLLKPEAYYDAPWRREPGSGMLHTNLIHDLDLLRYLCGEVACVQAMTSRDVRGFKVADTAAIMLRFENDALATLTASDTVAAPWSWELASGENPDYPHQAGQPCYLLAGTQGALSLPELRYWSYSGEAHWKAPLNAALAQPEPGVALQRQLGHFLDIVEGKAQPLVSVEDAARTLALIDAIERAAIAGGSTVPIHPWESRT